jgi:ADP-heptose:LPS heptosyltransferase/glycosyltransferase involved in cell wall biosynthesis
MNRILVIQLSRLGDLLHSLPLVKRLKEEHPDSLISLVCVKEFSPIAGCCPFVDRLIAIPVTDIIPLDTKEIVAIESVYSSRLEHILNIHEFHEEYDLVINLTHNLIGGLICGHVKSLKKSGRADDVGGRSVVLGRWAKYFFSMAPDRRSNLFNRVDIYTGMGEVPHRPTKDYLNVPPEVENDAIQILLANGFSQSDRLIGLQLGASNPCRVWPPANFASLANSLGSISGIEIVLLGTASEQIAAHQFLHQTDVPVIDLVGKTNLVQLAGIIRQCDLVIGNDTGPLHLASALGIRVLGLYFCSAHFGDSAPYGPGNVVIQAEPPCSPCHEGESCETLSCRDDLKAEAVIDAAEMILFDKDTASFDYPNLALYQSSFLPNGTIAYSPLSQSVSEQYQTGYINRRMFEAAFDLTRDPDFDRASLPRLLSAGGFGGQIEHRRNKLAQLKHCFQEALKTTHAIIRESTAASTCHETTRSLIGRLQHLEANIVASELSIIKNEHALEMMEVGSDTPNGLFQQLIPKYSRLYGLTVSSLAALEALWNEHDLWQSQEGMKYPSIVIPAKAEIQENILDSEACPQPLSGIRKYSEWCFHRIECEGREAGNHDEVLYLGLSSGENFGWGICGDYLTKELSKKIRTVALAENGELRNNRNLPGRVFHTLKAADLSTLFPARGTHNFGYTFFENELMPQSLMNGGDYDLVFSGSTWCKERLFEAGIKHVDVLIQGVDQEIFYPIAAEKSQDQFVIFSGGKFELRKGQDLVLHAIKILQAKYTDIVLVNVWYNKWPQTMQMMGLSPYIRFQLRGSSWLEIMDHLYLINGIDPTRVITYPIVSNHQLRSLYQQTDLGLFPNRCEGGTNLVLMEYMACAKPVIAAYTSGHKDILTENNSLMLTQLRKFPVHDQQNRLVSSWEEPSLDELIAEIEHAYHHRDEIKAIGRQAGEDLKKYTWKGAAAKVLAAIYG